MRTTDRGRPTVRGRVLSATGRHTSLVVGATGRLVDPGNPLYYAQQYELLFWLRATSVQYGTTLRAEGTSPPAWTISGTATRQVGLLLEIDSVAGGTGLGQATYKWSEDSGSTYVATGVATAAGPTALGTTGLSVSMAAGPYNIDNKWRIATAQATDQSGAGNHGTQVLASRQPVFEIVGGQPGMVFDGVNDLLNFASVLSTTRCSFFASLSVPSLTTDEPMLVTNQHGYYPSLASNGFFSCYANAAVSSGIALSSTVQVVSAVERAFNDIDLAVNNTVVTRTNGAGYPARGYALLGSENGFGRCAMTLREMAFFSDSVPAAIANSLRVGMAARTGVTL